MVRQCSGHFTPGLWAAAYAHLISYPDKCGLIVGWGKPCDDERSTSLRDSSNRAECLDVAVRFFREGEGKRLIGWAGATAGIIFFVFMQISIESVCWDIDVVKKAKIDEAIGCFDYWLNRYQTLVGALVAIGAAWYAGRWVRKQIKRTDEQIRISQEVNVNEYRAYVRLDFSSVVLEAGRPLRMVTVAVNYGRTPAFEYFARNQVAYAPAGWKWPSPRTIDAPGTPIKGVVQPGQNMEVVVSSGIMVDDQLIQKLRSGERVCHVRILAEYVDAFGFARETQIVMELSGEFCIDNQRPRFSDSGAIFT